jgi:two-component sensor histidine kinase
MRIVGRELLDRDGQRIGATVALIDIDAERGAIKAQRDQIRELNHRVRNAFTVTQAILSQALRHAGIEPELRNRINERIAVYARSHSFSIGGATPASAANGLVDQIVDPPSPSQLTIEGDPLRFDPTMTPLFALLLSELADNARRHGAWSDRARPDAKVHVGWRREGEGLRFTWHETGGPTAPSPRVSGFGDFIALRALPAETGGKAEQNAGAGVWTYTLDMPADRLG